MSIQGAGEHPAEPPAPPRRGRRRDADVDRRILDVARAVYAERGWTGFNFDVVAHQARVSKDAIYRRYASRIDLLLSAIAPPAGNQVPVAPSDDLRAYLTAVADWYFRNAMTSAGVNTLRVFLEARQNPELLEAYLVELVDLVLRGCGYDFGPH